MQELQMTQEPVVDDDGIGKAISKLNSRLSAQGVTPYDVISVETLRLGHGLGRMDMIRVWHRGLPAKEAIEGGG